MITNTKLQVPIVTLPTKDNNNLTKQLNDGFKRSIYWNQYVSKPFPETPHKKTGITRFALDAALQGVNRLFVLAFVETFMIKQLMTQLENMMKLERSRLEKEIITRMDVY